MGKSWSFCVDVAVVSNVSYVSVVATVIVLSPGEVRKAFTKCEMRTIELLLVSEASKQALMKVYLRREENASGNRVYFPESVASCLKAGACVWTPPQLTVSLQTQCFGFTVRHIGVY